MKRGRVVPLVFIVRLGGRERGRSVLVFIVSLDGGREGWKGGREEGSEEGREGGGEGGKEGGMECHIILLIGYLITDKKVEGSSY